jgi:HSP20 family molecular chaperone IbpA
MVAKRRILLDRSHISPEAQRVLREGWGAYQRTRCWEPASDVYEIETGLVIQVEIAGMSEEDFTITLGERSLVIEGTRRDPEQKRAYHQMEIRYGEFRTELHLPWTVDPDRVEATYEDGFLRVFLPRPSTHHVVVVEQKE